jgi:sugar lactone lactonase YvrE
MNAEVVLDGLVLGESPRWHDGRLWVADWAAHELITVDADGTRQVAARPASIPCCIDWLPDGRLLLVSGDRLLRREPDGTMVTHAELAHLDVRREALLFPDGGERPPSPCRRSGGVKLRAA